MQFIDLQAQRAYLGSRIDGAIARVLEHGRFIMGPEVKAFEEQLARFGGACHAIGCGNGTDALLLPLMAWGIGKGDAIFCPSFTFAATAEMIAITGATPVFVDVREDTFNIDPEKLGEAIDEIKVAGELTPRAIIAVDLFGQMADYETIRPIADAHGLKLIADAAQGFGASRNGKQAAEYADAVTTSFFPAKPLGCYGDGGAVLTNDDELAQVIDSLRVHGKGADKYDNVRIGVNSRLDTIQAAILIEKLAIFGEEIEKRMNVARRYTEMLSGKVQTPYLPEDAISTWAQYTIRLQDRASRDALQAALKEAGIPSVVYYARPLHLQTAYAAYPRGGGALSVTEALAETVLSLPMHPYLTETEQRKVAQAVLAAL